ncbi:MAG: beta-glucosidase [Thermomicrobia bacterium]|nr:beta-glucosidase [Thermomicrobia bacterium]
MATFFPDAFVWGTTTSAYQTEGAVREEGRGETIWDRFAHTPGKVRDGSTGDYACDSYHRYGDDIDLMRRLGVTAYRFSVAWSRIYPDGYGRLNRAGLDHYERVVDALLAANIAPYITLYHGDLPQAMQDRGGWANRDTISAFGEYADTLSRRLGDRVAHWVTHNEPWHVAYHGHVTGENAPGVRSWKTGVQVAHNLLVSHGAAVPVLRANGNAATRVGIAVGVTPCYPATDREADFAAAVRYDGFANRWFLDPLFRGAYPDDLMELFGADAPEVRTMDMATIAAPIDFLGVNYASHAIVRDDASPPIMAARLSLEDEVTDGRIEGLYDALTRVQRDYAPTSILITGNGVPDNAEPDEHNVINDRARLDYLRAIFPQMLAAIDAGVPLRGYFVWTLMDSFAFPGGYRTRFGLAYTDFSTQTRTLKASGHWYARVIAEGEVRDA